MDSRGTEIIVRDFQFTPYEESKPEIFVWVEENGKTVKGFVQGVPPDKVEGYEVHVWALIDGDAAYIQPFVGSTHKIKANDLSFDTWTRSWDAVRADLIEKTTKKVIASSREYRKGDLKPKRGQN
jgi:hypothetical protein